MSAPSNCCTSCCDTPEVVNVPGVEGAAGAAGADGADGTDGLNAFTILTADLTLPAVGNPVTATVEDNSWMVVGQIVVAGDGSKFGTFEVASKTGTTAASLTFQGTTGDDAPGDVIASGGTVSPGAHKPTYTLPTALTDNSTGAASNTIAAGVGIQTLAFYVEATALANGDVLTDYVPGYAFKILKFDARCAVPVTTGAKAATLNLEIGSTNLTGGVIALAGTYAQGAAQAGSAVTGNNTGASTDSISIEASSVTTFIEGAFWLLIEIQNMDSANAVASLADHVNDLITALT